MSGYGGPGPGRGPDRGSGPGGAGQSSVGQRIDEAVELIEMELRHAIAYLNDAVIPQVRKESIGAMRTAADTLKNLADRFERQAGESRQNQTGQNQPGQNPSAQNPSTNQTSTNQTAREPRG
jgi:hypothetical protein